MSALTRPACSHASKPFTNTINPTGTPPKNPGFFDHCYNTDGGASSPFARSVAAHVGALTDGCVSLEVSGVKNRGFWSDVSVLKGDLDIYKGIERCGRPSGGN